MPATDTCRWCHGTGWMTIVDYDGSAYDVPCADDDCLAPQPASGDTAVPY